MQQSNSDENYNDLDPQEWQSIRILGHRMLDDMIDYLADIRQNPVWRPMPDSVCAELQIPLPSESKELELIYEDFCRLIMPYFIGAHPRLVGWVHGGGTAAGMLADILTAGMNANVGGRNHSPVKLEKEVIRWAAEMLGYPSNASGVLVTGTSIANFIAVIVARTRLLGQQVRQNGLQGKQLVAYTSAAAHVCVSRAMDMSGLGSNSLRLIPCDALGRMQVSALEQRITTDIANGFVPFLVIATAGSVDTGAIDDLMNIAAVCKREKLWFHVDAAFGAIGMLSPTVRLLLNGISESDSVAFDFHKWGQVQYDAGCLVVKDASAHANAFSSHASYLGREQRGLAAGHPWPCDFGPDLSRGFRALKVWMTLQVYGTKQLGAVVDHCCELAQAMAKRIEQEPELELIAPVTLNVICFRYIGKGDTKDNLDQLNKDIVADLQESGIAAPSTSIVNGQLAIRAAFVNHRTRLSDINALLDGVLTLGRKRYPVISKAV